MSLLPMSGLAASIEEIFETLVKLSIPLYVDFDGAPALIGTGFFVKLDGSVLLMSAAHVLEQARVTEVYYCCKPNQKRYVMGSLTVNRHDGPRAANTLRNAEKQCADSTAGFNRSLQVRANTDGWALRRPCRAFAETAS